MTIIRTFPEDEADGEVGAGFRDPEIVDLAMAAAARVYLGRMLQALAVAVDVPERLSEPLRSALVDGL